MKKHILALSVLAAISGQANAFKFDTSDDWSIRWDNTFKLNVMSRVAKQDDDVLTDQAGAAFQLADDADLSVNRRSGGLVSTRLDVISELDVVWKDNFGFRISGSAWYDPQYGDGENDHPEDRRLSWASPSAEVGEYNHEAQDLHYAGGELLDAFVFANFNIGDETSLGIRAGRHTIYWGQGLLTNGALHGIGGAMAPIDFNKALSVPGSEAKELFMPTGKVSSVLQLGGNLTLNAYYSYEFQAYRYPEDGTYWSPAEGLSENSEFLAILPGDPIRTGHKMRGFSEDTGDYGFNVQYYVESLGLETSFIYINYTDKNLHGLIGVIGSENAPGLDLEAGTNAFGEGKWVFKNDIDLFGIALNKEIAGVSVGMDLVYRKNNGLAPEFRDSVLQSGIDFQAADPDNYPGAVGDTWHLNINGVKFLNADLGLWDGGTLLLEATFSMLDDCTKNCQLLDSRVYEGRVVSQVAAVFRPTWYQVRPGWDMSLPMSVNYTIDGEKSPTSAGGDEEGGAASVGVQLDINQQWLVTAAYNARFGPVLAGTGGLLKDRDNVSLTVKYTL
tara:strand:+ start:491168 stop:492841 length:1674 start_codon:yes stop_codon:yes gene_type:complete